MSLPTDGLSNISSDIDAHAHPGIISSSFPSSNHTLDSVPPEIWSEIFQWSHRLYEPIFYHGPFHEPVNFCSYGAVCSKWRSIMLQTPGLWANVELCASDPYITANEALTVWLQRSKNHPIVVVIDVEGLDDSDFKQFFDCVGTLLQHGCRWHWFYLRTILDTDGPNWMRHWPRPLLDASILEKCTLAVQSHDSPLILNAPRRKEVHLTAEDINGVPLTLLPYSSVTRLALRHMDYYTAEEQAEYLKACPLLEELVVTGMSNDDSEDIRPFVHSSVQKFTICGFRANLLSGLVAPALTRLDLKLSEGLSSNDSASVQHFVRNTTSLRKLAFAGPCNVYHGLKNVRHIEGLQLSGAYKDVIKFNRSIGTLKDPTVLPRLRRLVVLIDFRSSARGNVVRNPNHYYSFRDRLLQLCQERLCVRSKKKSRLLQVHIEILACSDDMAVFQNEAETVLGMRDLGIKGLRVVVNDSQD